ncbi:uncharacterized protein LOC120342847 [Styela clava]
MPSSKHEAKLLFLIKKLIRRQHSATGCTINKICRMIEDEDIGVNPCEIGKAVRNALEIGIEKRELVNVADDVFAIANMGKDCQKKDGCKKRRQSRSKSRTSTSTLYSSQNQQSRELRDRVKDMRREYRKSKERKSPPSDTEDETNVKSSPTEKEKPSKIETVKCCADRAYRRMGMASHKVGPSLENMEIDENGSKIARSVYDNSHAKEYSSEENCQKDFTTYSKRKRKKLRKRRVKFDRQKSVAKSSSSSVASSAGKPKFRRKSRCCKKKREDKSSKRHMKPKRKPRELAKTIKRNNNKIFCLW